MNVRRFGPEKPVVDIGNNADMRHAVGKRRRHAAGNGAVSFPIARRKHAPAVGQAVFPDAAIKNELIAGRLHQRRRGVEFVEEKNALGRVVLVRQKRGRAPDGFSVGGNARQAAQIHRIEQDGANIVQEHAAPAGGFGNKAAFADAGRPPEEGGLSGGEQDIKSSERLRRRHRHPFLK